MYPIVEYRSREPWNKGKLVGQKSPLKLKDIWAIRIRLQLNNKLRDLALFNLAIDSKLRACDLTKLRVSDVAHSGRVGNRAMVMQQKTKTPVQFEKMEQTRDSLTKWIEYAGLGATGYLFPSRVKRIDHLSTRQYARIVKGWIESIGLDSAVYGTHSLRRTKASLNYRITEEPRIYELYSCFWAIPSWEAPSDTLELRWMMPLRRLSRLKSEILRPSSDGR